MSNPVQLLWINQLPLMVLMALQSQELELQMYLPIVEMMLKHSH